jgi:hypothetical protein
MDRRQPLGQLRPQTDHLCPGQPADPADHAAQVLAADILHREIPNPVRAVAVQHPGHVGMADQHTGAGFSLEPSGRHRLQVVACLDKLDHADLIEMQMTGQQDSALRSRRK